MSLVVDVPSVTDLPDEQHFRSLVALPIDDHTVVADAESR